MTLVLTLQAETPEKIADTLNDVVEEIRVEIRRKAASANCAGSFESGNFDFQIFQCDIQSIGELPKLLS